ncbi:MAG: CDP-alcohol phosphatidyltransferase family protein [Phyllobacteriaceae bacterium]|nr:CDP-alcohol phosphatidyltransferase family protein [Phyllobacteriaceae bacterium]
MLDGWARERIDPVLNAMGERLAAAGVSANAVTLAAFAVGVAAAIAISIGWFWPGLALIAFSRLGDGLDGVVARKRGKTDFGGFLDLVLDFGFYAAIPLGFAIADPTANALAAAVLVAAFYVNGATFLGYAALAAKRGLDGAARGEKSVYFTTGLAEATETFAVFAAFCLFPGWFTPIAWIFAAACLWTAFWRIVEARRVFV